MKKGLVLLSLVLVAGSLVALDISAGASSVVGSAWESYSLSGELLGMSVEGTEAHNWFTLGGKVFGDFTYGQAGVGYRVVSYGGGELTSTVDGDTTTDELDDTDAALHYITFELLGKYPFDLGGVILAPVGGLAYDLCTAYYDADGEKVDPDDIYNYDGKKVGYSYFNNLRLVLGGAVDVPFGNLYVRTQGLFSLVLSQEYMKDYERLNKDLMEAYGGENVSSSSSFTALEISVGIGYKF
ncbi:hypothetical protein Spith_1969 [Spirochaeta thermophila DSM 6578]|uniref:Outer membrane protein beta-barrel domain-containing protein n=1 Tax=Winmispira thermophila (strain ATCC 700085 / DSM 6578 / Z-1203) TaxID=869211 RepID=G0GDU7_WINT7|nr:hypothetical protein [Spirochaeta thermophila]AEJ62227.1 hypothetical protein Spith_1969 [Spirochaeta thermophila DSM 6578]